MSDPSRPPCIPNADVEALRNDLYRWREQWPRARAAAAAGDEAAKVARMLGAENNQDQSSAPNDFRMARLRGKRAFARWAKRVVGEYVALVASIRERAAPAAAVAAAAGIDASALLLFADDLDERHLDGALAVVLWLAANLGQGE
jgi:hypothetical protein